MPLIFLHSQIFAAEKQPAEDCKDNLNDTQFDATAADVRLQTYILFEWYPIWCDSSRHTYCLNDSQFDVTAADIRLQTYMLFEWYQIWCCSMLLLHLHTTNLATAKTWEYVTAKSVLSLQHCLLFCSCKPKQTACLHVRFAPASKWLASTISPDVILSGWLGSKHQLTKWLAVSSESIHRCWLDSKHQLIDCG